MHYLSLSTDGITELRNHGITESRTDQAFYYNRYILGLLRGLVDFGLTRLTLIEHLYLDQENIVWVLVVLVLYIIKILFNLI